ncbi:hypothetical protein CDL12_27149 [Handroanthus impetiginosus]|uniref:Protein SPT2 homolog n=1 Tax=Handroanthus impetiginosus TaxID=429701 RepID=A0A2G9G4V8_9LAMI|nr:hypothetical protein CDL12_27149 [Handroanthus impetiginosus]
MRRHEGDEYEDWDEYEEDGEEQEEQEGNEDEYEENQQPTQEELEYLSLRQRIKESIRKKRKNDLGTANAGSHNDNYGSFFGPSRPVIAQRVIQESKSLLENPDLAARLSRLNRTKNKSSVSAPVKSKPQSNHPPRVTNGLRKKVEMMKNTRDYSFLLSEDVEAPASTRTAPPKSVSTHKSDAQSVQLLPRSKQVVNDRGRDVSDGRDRRKPVSGSSQSKPKVDPGKVAPTRKLSIDSRKQLGNNNGSGPGRPLGPKGVPSKSPVPATLKTAPPVARNMVAATHKPTSSSLQPGVRKPMPSNLPSSNHRPPPSNGQPSHLKKSSVPRKEYQEASKPKMIAKQPLPPPREQLRRPPPKVSARGASSDERPKPKPKRPIRDEDSDDENAINMIRQMFGYNPNKFRDDDDDSDMEANFDDIMREERRSAKIARKEDEEQLRLIEEEERRERARLAKKRKLSGQ